MGQNNFKVITDKSNSFFVNNKFMVGTQTPTSGEYNVGDIVVNNGSNSTNIPMWICVKSGNPGTWVVFNSGSGGGTDSNNELIQLKNNVIVSGEVNEVEIGIDGFNKNYDVLTVYKNTVYMIEGVDYNISADGTKIVSKNGNWNAENLDDYTFTFIVLKYVSKINPDAVVGMENLKDDVKEAIANAGSDIDISGKQDKNDNSLITNDKTIVGAINELFTNANNGKQLIADAIGEPLNSDDTFSAMSGDINGLLSTFKVNMMNAGATVESSDKFKALIDKIAKLVGNNSGIQFVSGTYTPTKHMTDSNSGYWVTDINFNFEPTIFFVYYKATVKNTAMGDIKYEDYEDAIFYNSLEDPDKYFITTYDVSDDYMYCHYVGIDKTDTTYSIDLGMQIETHFQATFSDCKWYAIGVGEEDNTLRDSLASVLEEEGVEVLEEDTMADLIVKTDEEFARKNARGNGLNIISATKLPNTGVENQICVITDNPVEEFIVSQFTDDMTNVGDTICLDLATSVKTDSKLVMIDDTRVKTYYYVNRVIQSGEAKDTYVYTNGKWVLLCEGVVYLLLDGVESGNVTFGEIYVYKSTFCTRLETGEIGLSAQHQSNYSYDGACFSFNNSISFDDYTKVTLRCKLLYEAKWNPIVYVGLTDKAYSGTITSESGYSNFGSGDFVYYYYNRCSSITLDTSYPAGEYFNLEFDISDITGNGYLCIGIQDDLSEVTWFTVNTITIQ